MEHTPGSTHPINEEPARADDLFTTETTGLPEATSPRLIRLTDGDRFALGIQPVRKRLEGSELRMLGYNGSIPGPTLHVDQGSEITVEVTNDGDVEATVHWHGLRLENRYDGVPHETQSPIPIGGTFTYKVQFPDAGFYWYHPHIREDFGLEMGLYGTIIVEPTDPSYWPPVDRQLSITLDDLLVEDGHVAPFNRAGPNYTAMGRFGNVMLINGEAQFSGEAAVGEVVRLYLVNTANTRIFNFALPGSRMKLVGGDSGRYERETFIDEVMLAPSERAVVDVTFDNPGEVRLEHRTPDHVYDLGAFSVAGNGTAAAAGSFEALRVDPLLTAEHRTIGADIERPPDKVLAFVASMPLLYGDDVAPPTSYACPMHPEVTSSEPGTCPKCGMQLLPVRSEEPPPASYVCPMHPEVTSSEPGTCPKCGMKLVPADTLPASAPKPHEEVVHARARPSRAERRTRMGRPDAGDQPCLGRQQHEVDADRPGDRGRERRHHMGVHRGRPGEDPARERDGVRPPDAPSVPRSRCGALPRPVTRRRAGAEPGLEGHRAGSRGNRPWTSCSTSRTRACGWRTATSPSTPRAA